MSIYFVQAKIGGPVKIGFAKNPEQRLKELQCGSPFVLRILRVIDGSISDEQALHRQFAHARLHGEWFDASDELKALIASPEYRAVRKPRVTRALGQPMTRPLPVHGPLIEFDQAIIDVIRHGEGKLLRSAQIRSRHDALAAFSPSAIAQRCLSLMRRGWAIEAVKVENSWPHTGCHNEYRWNPLLRRPDDIRPLVLAA